MRHSHERRFDGDPGRLRSAERLARLEIAGVVALSLEGLRAAKVVDIGTGTAVFAEAFHHHGASVMGVEPNVAMLGEARRHAPGIRFVSGVAEALPLRDKYFDLSFLGTVLHEADDGAKALAEAARVSRHRVVVLEFPYLDEDDGPPLAHRLRREAILSMAEAAGLKNDRHVPLQSMDLYVLSPAGRPLAVLPAHHRSNAGGSGEPNARAESGVERRTR